MIASLLLILRLALILTLYGFLAWAFLTLWRDLQMQGKLLTLRQPPPVGLWVKADGDSVPVQFAGQAITIGRDPLCDMILDNSTVSAQHARFSYRQGQWWLEDLHSTNGTFLNREAVVEPVVVTSGDELRCGQVTMRIKIGPSEPA
jgi:hypothetical protein